MRGPSYDFRADSAVEVKTLMGTFPGATVLETALDLAARAPSAQNSQPWQWHVGRDGVGLHADWTRRLGDTDSDRRDLLLSCGTVLDHCVVALDAAGWRPRVHRLPDPGDAGHLALLELVEQPPSDFGVQLAAAIPRRRADRRRYLARAIPAGTLEWLYVCAARSGVRLGVVPKIRWARRTDGEILLRYGGRPGDDDGARGDDATMVVLGTEADNDLMRLRAGETLSRITLSAAAMGFATCPLTEPLGDVRSRLALACEVFDGEAHPQTLIRVGWAPDGDPPAPASRRPVGETTTWDRRN